VWSTSSCETARQTGASGMGGLSGGEGGPDRVQYLMALYRDVLLSAPNVLAAR
jgi:hypothetical protein